MFGLDEAALPLRARVGVDALLTRRLSLPVQVLSSSGWLTHAPMEDSGEMLLFSLGVSAVLALFLALSVVALWRLGNVSRQDTLLFGGMASTKKTR